MFETVSQRTGDVIRPDLLIPQVEASPRGGWLEEYQFMEHWSVTEIPAVVPLGGHHSSCLLQFFKNTSLEQITKSYKCVLRRLLLSWVFCLFHCVKPIAER